MAKQSGHPTEHTQQPRQNEHGKQDTDQKPLPVDIAKKRDVHNSASTTSHDAAHCSGDYEQKHNGPNNDETSNLSSVHSVSP